MSSNKIKLVLVLVITITGYGSWFLLGRIWPVLLDHPTGYGDAIVILVCGASMVAASLSTLILIWQFPEPKRVLPVIGCFVVRVVACIVGFAGLVIGIASGFILFGRSMSPLRFEDRFTWYVGLGLAALGVLWSVVETMLQGKRRRRKKRRR